MKSAALWFSPKATWKIDLLGGVRRYVLALIYVGLGDNDRAMVWLNKAYQARFNPSILVRPAFDPLRSDARFQDLLHRVGIP
jgi:hypothetical protein